MMNPERKYCNCIAFYTGPNEKIDYKEWYSFCIQLLKILDLQENYIGITGNGYYKKLVKASTGKKRLFSKNFEDIVNLSFYVTPSGSESPTYEWFFLMFSGETTRGQETLICFDEKLMDFYSPEFKKVIQTLSKTGVYKYGIAYRRAFSKGPDSYALGALQGIDDNSTESIPIRNWFKDRINDNNINNGLMRDIYPYNILSEVHLNKEINGISLKDWIVQKSWFNKDLRGSLNKIGDCLYLWTVEMKNIQNVRQSLAPLLISYHPDVISSIP